jgi:tetratricopeptide (TPR) repeat protein
MAVSPVPTSDAASPAPSNDAASPPPSSSSESPSPPSNLSEPTKPARKRYAPPLLALLVIALCLAVIGGVAAFVVYPQICAKYHWDQAKKGIANNDLAGTDNHWGAEKHLEECLKVWKTDGEVYFLMARTERRIGKFDQAREYLQKAKKHNWVPEEIKLENLLMKAQSGYLPDATKQLQVILEEGNSDDVYIMEALIIGCLQTNFFTEADRWANVWITQHPDDWLAHYWRGAVLDGANQYPLAKEEYLKALDLNPHGFDLHLRIAEVVMREKSFEEAMPHYEQALVDDPENPVALLGLARCQQSLHSTDVAKVTLDRLLALQPKFIGAYDLYGQFAIEEERPKEALEWLKKAQAIDPNDRITNQKLVEVLHQLHRDDEAREIQRRTEEQERQLTRLEDINKELLSQPKNVMLRNEAGNILLQLGKHDKALQWFVSAYLIEPKDPAAKEGMRKCLLKTGDKELMERYRSFFGGQP